jgi:hypothetical protein
MIINLSCTTYSVEDYLLFVIPAFYLLDGQINHSIKYVFMDLRLTFFLKHLQLMDVKVLEMLMVNFLFSSINRLCLTQYKVL